MYSEEVSDSQPVSGKKYQGLIDLCEELVIPRQYHAFYKALPHGKVIPEERDYRDESDDETWIDLSYE